jgi:hypothetical protein
MPKRSQVKKLHQPEPELPPGIALAWGRVTSPRRGPRPGYTLEEIVRTAIKLADKHGISALSLPSIADRLGLSRNGGRAARINPALGGPIHDSGGAGRPHRDHSIPAAGARQHRRGAGRDA